MINYTVQCDRCKVESEKKSTRDLWVSTPKDWKDVTLTTEYNTKIRVHFCPTCSVALFVAVDRIIDAPEEQIVNLIREIVVKTIDNR